MDLSVNLGNLITIISIIVSGVAIFVKMGTRVDLLCARMMAVETEVKDLVNIMVEQGRHDERMNAIDTRLAGQSQRLDETIERLNRYFNGRGGT